MVCIGSIDFPNTIKGSTAFGGVHKAGNVWKRLGTVGVHELVSKAVCLKVGGLAHIYPQMRITEKEDRYIMGRKRCSCIVRA